MLRILLDTKTGLVAQNTQEFPYSQCYVFLKIKSVAQMTLNSNPEGFLKMFTCVFKVVPLSWAYRILKGSLIH